MKKTLIICIVLAAYYGNQLYKSNQLNKKVNYLLYNLLHQVYRLMTKSNVLLRKVVFYMGRYLTTSYVKDENQLKLQSLYFQVKRKPVIKHLTKKLTILIQGGNIQSFNVMAEPIAVK